MIESLTDFESERSDLRIYKTPRNESTKGPGKEFGSRVFSKTEMEDKKA